MGSDFPTRAVQLTPAGRGAVAVVRVIGSRALDIVQQSFHSASGKALVEFPVGRICYGRWGGIGGEDVVVTRLADSTQVDIHCHGGSAAIKAVLRRLSGGGCAIIDWQDALSITHSDPLQAAAARELAAAATTKTARILLDQFHDALGRSIRAILLALENQANSAAVEQLQGLLRFDDLGLHLTTPWRVVLTGPPNVGKSSLINALVGFERAIVSAEPGTTRDIVTAVTAVGGWPLELADTAGVRQVVEPLEREGINRAKRSREDADLVVVVVDATESSPPASLLEGDDRKRAVLVVVNKIDLLTPEHIRAVEGTTPGRYATSTVTGVGIEELLVAIQTALVPVEPAPGAAIPFTTGQVQQLRSAKQLVQGGQTEDASQLLHSMLSTRKS